METDEFGIPIIHRDCAEEFLIELDEIHSRWKDSTWLYRGQIDSSWNLHPSAMRCKLIDEQVKLFALDYLHHDPGGNDLKRGRGFSTDVEVCKFLALVAHWTIENNLVAVFEELADSAGLDLPIESYHVLQHLMRNLWNKLENRDPDPTAFTEHFSVEPHRISFALAQHHGVPTRLLDWTFRPHVAAFFAAHSEQQVSIEPERIVVWAFEQEGLPRTSLAIVSHLRSRIGFLQSQDGIFLYDTTANDKFFEHGCWQPFEVEFAKAVDRGGVYKLTFPYKNRARLLEQLQLKEISKPNLMPSYDNVAEQIMKQRIDWRRIRLGGVGHVR